MEGNSIAKGTFIITLANAFQYVVISIFYIIVTKTNALTQTDIGTLSILTFLTSTFSLMTLLALPTALTKLISEKIGKNQKEEAMAAQKTVITTVSILSIVGFAVAVLLSQLISQELWNNTDYIFLLILNFAFAFLSNIKTLFDSIFQAFYLFGKMAILTLVFIVSNKGIAIFLALLNMGVTGVIIGYIVGAIITLTIAIIFLRKKLPRKNKKTPLKPIMSYSFPLFLTSITNLVLGWADIILITYLIGDLSLTGIYFIVVSSVAVLQILYSPMMTTIFPTLAAHHGLAEPKNISRIVNFTSRYIFYILFPSCVGLAIVAPTALTFFYGSSYAIGAIPLAILSFMTAITGLTSLFNVTFQAIGKTKQILNIKIVESTSLILILLALVPLLETTGAALTHLVTKIMVLAIAIYLLRKEIRIRLDKEALWKSVVSTTAFIPFLVAIEMALSTKLSTVQIFILEILTALAIYIFSLYILKALHRQDFDLLREAFPKPLTKYINIIEKIIGR